MVSFLYFIHFYTLYCLPFWCLCGPIVSTVCASFALPLGCVVPCQAASRHADCDLRTLGIVLIGSLTASLFRLVPVNPPATRCRYQSTYPSTFWCPHGIFCTPRPKSLLLPHHFLTPSC